MKILTINQLLSIAGGKLRMEFNNNSNFTYYRSNNFSNLNNSMSRTSHTTSPIPLHTPHPIPSPYAYTDKVVHYDSDSNIKFSLIIGAFIGVALCGCCLLYKIKDRV